MAIKLLAVGDLHLGRLPGRLPEMLVEQAAELGPEAAWRRTVALAQREGVDAVVLTGDVVESSDDFFEALPRLREGVEQLVAAGIRVIGVAGNHDGEVLPALADRITNFELLGKNGQWESTTVTAGEDTLILWGWSFPGRTARQDPLATFPGHVSTTPALGLLHCDRDQTDSPYAPVTRHALADSGLDGWLLGHIHQPDPLILPRPMGYLGSVTGLDAGETGPRGPWLITLEKGTFDAVTHQILAPLHWANVPVEVSDAVDEDAVETQLIAALEQIGATLRSAVMPPRAVGLRVVYTGVSDLPETAFPAGLGRTAVFTLPGTSEVSAFIESTRLDLRPVIPLQSLARRDDHAGLLAQRLLLLDREPGDPEREAMLDRAAAVAQEAAQEGAWRRIAEAPVDRESVADWLRERGQAALRQILSQQGAS